MNNSAKITKLLLKVGQTYQIAQQPRLVEKVKSGYLSQNFILQSGKTRLFLKQYRFDSIERINEIQQVKFFLSQGGIPVVLPIKNNLGNFIFEHNHKFYSLFPFVKGKILRRRNRSSKAFASAGRMLAQIHALSKNGYPGIVKKKEKGWNKKEFLPKASEIQKQVESIENKTSFDRLALEVLQLKTKLVNKNDLSYRKLSLPGNHIIHGDYHAQNIFFDNNDEVKYIFDLEKTRLAPRVLEIVRSMDFMCFSGDFKSKSFSNANTYLKAYCQTYPINKNELERGIKAYYLKKVHSLWIEIEHYLNKNFRVDCFLEQELLMLRYYPKNYKIFIKKLDL